MNDQELKNVLTFLIALATQVQKIVANGKVSLFDIPGFYGAFEAAGPALSGIKDLPEEVKAINDATLTDLRTYLQTHLGSAVPNPAIEGLINDGLALAQQLFDFVNTVKSVKNPASPGAPPATPPATPVPVT